MMYGFWLSIPCHGNTKHYWHTSLWKMGGPSQEQDNLQQSWPKHIVVSKWYAMKSNHHDFAREITKNPMKSRWFPTFGRYVEVSWTRGNPPQSSISTGFSLTKQNHRFWGTHVFSAIFHGNSPKNGTFLIRHMFHVSQTYNVHPFSESLWVGQCQILPVIWSVYHSLR